MSITTEIYVANSSDPVGSITTENQIQGSLINNFGIKQIIIYSKNIEDPIAWILSSKFKIAGSPRKQQIWNIKHYEEDGDRIILEGVTLRPEGLCIACAGTGKFISLTHKATAKCPSCKGNGYVDKVWSDQEMVGKGEDTSGIDRGEVQ